MRLHSYVLVVISIVALVFSAVAQTNSESLERSAAVSIPRLIRFSGVAKDETNRPVSGVLGVTFALYKDEQGGAPLWSETQNVQADANGRYTALLGSATAEGVPLDLFISAEAHWIGVQISDHPEQPRVLLLSVPYALKAADAETLSGLPASAFVHENTATASASATAKQATNPTSNSAGTSAAITGSGSTDFIPLWTSTTTLGSSVLFQTGGNVGVGTKTPGAKLDTDGPAIVLRGTSSGTTGTGVFGVTTSKTGANFGVQGTSASPTGAGGRFQNTSTATGAKILIAEDSSGTQRFSVDVQGNVSLVTGTKTKVAETMRPVNHARGVVNILQNQNYFVTLTWSFPFPDTSYTVSCSPLVPSSFQGAGSGVYLLQVTLIAMTTVQVEIAAEGGTGDITIHCIGVHD